MSKLKYKLNLHKLEEDYPTATHLYNDLMLEKGTESHEELIGFEFGKTTLAKIYTGEAVEKALHICEDLLKLGVLDRTGKLYKVSNNFADEN
jgi:hypothetical protein